MESGVYQSGRPVWLQVCYPHGYQAHSPKFTASSRWSFLHLQDGVSLACSFPPSFPPFDVLNFQFEHQSSGCTAFQISWYIWVNEVSLCDTKLTTHWRTQGRHDRINRATITMAYIVFHQTPFTCESTSPKRKIISRHSFYLTFHVI